MAETFVRLDPSVDFGRPLVGRSPVGVVAGAVWAGDPVDDVADEYGLSVPQVLVACWYMARYGSRVWHRRWGAWLRVNEAHLWSCHHDQVADPPAVDRG